MKFRVIARNNLPTQLPVKSTCIWFLMLSHFNAIPALWWASGVVIFLYWVIVLILFTCEERVDLFDKKQPAKDMGEYTLEQQP